MSGFSAPGASPTLAMVRGPGSMSMSGDIPEQFEDERDDQGDLERALIQIKGVATVLTDLGPAGAMSVAYLADQLREHYADAHDAFSRICKLDEYNEQESAQ
jgi:hypothetical protein